MKKRVFIITSILLIIALCCAAFSACSITPYQITYEMNGGTNHASNPTSYTRKTDTVTLLDPTRPGYSFVKWSEGNTIAKGSKGDKTFTAEWTKDTYAITYVLDGGTNHADNPTGYDVESATITLKNPSKAGYTFVKWTEGDAVEAGSTGNKTFTAEWAKVTYTITYVLGGGMNHAENPTVYDVESATFSLKNPSKAGYTFLKWTEGSTVVAGSTGNKTFSAEWTRVAYTITYVLGGGTNHADNPAGYGTDSAIITLKNPTKTGYTFVKWTEGGTVAAGSTGNKTFTAEWSPVTYSITYTLNGGTQNAANPTVYTVESAIITLAEPTYNGYVFGGWFDNAGLSGTAITTISASSTGNKNYYAKWNEIFTYSGTTITGRTATGFAVKDIIIPTGFTAIADNAFKDVTDITSLVVPADITSIGASAFSGCTSLASVTLNEGLLTIGNNAFIKCAFSTFTVPSTVASVGDSVLGGCAKLAELTIPYPGSSATATLKYGASNFGSIFGTTDYDSGTSNNYFTECASENSVGSTIRYQIPNASKTVNFNTELCTTIKSYVFHNCTTLETINLPGSVTKISSIAFYNCSGLIGLVLPMQVSAIESRAFDGCTNLSTITLQGQFVIPNLAASGIFVAGRTIRVPSAYLASYQSVYPGQSSMFVAIAE